MCGFAFLKSYRNMLNNGKYCELLSRIQIRGRDDFNMIVEDGYSAAHARLALIDIQMGKQPMRGMGRGGRYIIVFNGEIYNYKYLRNLLSMHYTFRTNSDTEVIIAAFLVWGHNCLIKLNGMFSFVIYDSSNDTIFAARDPSGQKPLYYSEDGEQFLFSSCPFEVNNSFRLSDHGISTFMQNGYTSGSNTMLHNVYQIEPGHYCIVKNNILLVKRYFDPGNIVRESVQWQYSFDDEVSCLYELLKRSVKRALVADIPVGLLISGGIDSSLLLSIYRLYSSDYKCFTLDIGGDESEVGQVLKYYESERLQIANGTIADANKFKYVYGKIHTEPFSDSSSINTAILMESVAQERNCVIGGDGADELFGGYEWRFEHLLDTYPAMVLRARRVYSQIKSKLLDQSFDFRFSPLYRYPIFYSDEITRLFGIGKMTPCNETSDKVMACLSNDLDKVILSDFLDFLPYDINRKSDEVGLHYGVEVRSPYQDIELIDFALSLPTQSKLAWKNYKRHLKYLHKKAYKNVASKPKKGFGLDVTKYLKRDDMQSLFNYYTSNSSMISRITDVSFANKLLNDNYTSRRWTFMVLSAWLEENLK